tara:strand:+ start:294 stop:548 length:255 start_codon:yes stop_codon:yes gene_type:complete
MPRLSIDISPEQHQKLKAIAALKGQSIKEYVLEQSLSDAPEISDQTEAEALAKLESFLLSRKNEAQSGDVVKTSAQDIFADTLS